MPPTPVIEIDLDARTVVFDRRPVALHNRAYELLVLLSAAPDRAFAAAELKASLWPGLRVDDANLRVQVQTLRKALGPAAVLNLRPRGYRLGLPVHVQGGRRRRGNLPCSSNELLGRTADVAALQPLLRNHRLVNVVGPAGIGKTRLALHLADQELTLHRDGVWWIDLAPVATGPEQATALAQAVAQALNVQTAPLVGRGAAANLAAALAHWQALLLMDNAEHLAGDGGPMAPLTRALLQAAPGLRLLMTSQQTLRIPEERVYRLDALAVPPRDASPGTARGSPALQLLEQRARSSDQAFRIAEADLPLAADIVRRLDGIALAIEMAAAHLPLLGVQALHDQLLGRPLLLAARADSSQARHLTLRHALDWSHGLLSPAERAALRRLSVFAGSFDIDCARQVAAADGMDEETALRAVFGLNDKSLLKRIPPAREGLPPRMRLLECTRLYAAQALDACAPAERHDTHRRHARAMAALARRACEHLYRASDAEWCERWLPDLDDLMLGFDRARACGEVEAAAQIIEALVLGANVTGRVEPALARAEASRELAAGAPPLARARLLGWGSNLPRSNQSRQEAGQARVQVWREVERTAGRQGLCTALAMLALACEEAGDRAAADAALAECRQLESATWPPRLRRRCSWIALSRMALLRDDAALRAEADGLTQLLGEQLWVQGAWREWSILQLHRAQMLRLQGRPAEAAAMLQDLSAQRLARGFDLDAGISLGLASAAMLEAGELADPESRSIEAREVWEQAAAAAFQALSRLSPLPALVRNFIESLALMACRLGDPAHGALLLAGGERLLAEHRYGRDPMNAAIAARVAAVLDGALPAQARRDADARGRSLDASELWLEALAWLRRRLDRPSGRSDASADPGASSLPGGAAAARAPQTRTGTEAVTTPLTKG